MTTVAELHAEAARLRAFALSETGRDVVLQEIQDMIEELERRARALGMALLVSADPDSVSPGGAAPAAPE